MLFLVAVHRYTSKTPNFSFIASLFRSSKLLTKNSFLVDIAKNSNSSVASNPKSMNTFPMKGERNMTLLNITYNTLSLVLATMFLNSEANLLFQNSSFDREWN